jgi:hypothetical protein
LPSGLKFALKTSAVCPTKVCRRGFECKFQSRWQTDYLRLNR